MLEEIKVYAVNNSNLDLIYEGGYLEKFQKRPIKTENWLIDIKMNQGEKTDIYMKVKSIYPLQMPISVSSKSGYVVKNRYHNLFWGLYIGIIAFAILYNFFVFLSVKDLNYLYYIIVTLSIAIFYLGVEGFGTAYIWPNNPRINLYLPSIISFANIVFIFFTFRFLQITSKQKYAYFLGWLLMATQIITIITNLAGFFNFAVLFGQVTSLFAAIYYLTIGVHNFIKGTPTARFFLLAWTSFLIFMVIAILAANNVIPSNFFTIHCIFIGHMTEVLLLSFALADNINWLKLDNENKQKEIIFRMKENEIMQTNINIELEQKVSERTSDLQKQKNLSDTLLLNILPSKVAEELKEKGHSEANFFELVTVMFTDFKGFTEISADLNASEVVTILNECFSIFDEISLKNGIEKIKTIGDAYMAVGGLPTINTTHAKDAVRASLEIQAFLVEYNVERDKKGLAPFEARIGIHSGPVVAGIVGTNKFAYDIWGDTVNIASRMESNGEVNRVNLSGTTYELIKDEYECEYRGKIVAKGKGHMDMYFIK
jgi:class 3 adenylate cyclase